MKRYIKSALDSYESESDWKIMHSVVRPYYTGFAVFYVEDNHAEILFKGSEDECHEWKRKQVRRILEY